MDNNQSALPRPEVDAARDAEQWIELAVAAEAKVIKYEKLLRSFSEIKPIPQQSLTQIIKFVRESSENALQQLQQQAEHPESGDGA